MGSAESPASSSWGRHLTALTATCAQCGAAAPLLFEARDWNRQVTDESFNYYRCRGCGVVFLHPVPEDLSRYYPGDYHDIPHSRGDVLRGRHHEAFKLEAIGGLGNGRRLFEIGPSYGRFAVLAQDAGFGVKAMEMDPACCAFLKDVLEIPVHPTRDVGAALHAAGRFHVIALWHSLEHLRDPWTVIDALPDHLEGGGLLAIATPNPLSFQFRFFGRRWVHLDAPRHVSLIPPAVLESRLLRRRLRRLHFSSRDAGARDCNLLGWLASPKSLIPQWMQRRPLSSIGWRLSRLLAKLDERDPYDSAYTVVFRKE